MYKSGQFFSFDADLTLTLIHFAKNFPAGNRRKASSAQKI